MSDYSKILLEAYGKFLLPLGGKKVPSPYRVNIPYQSDRRKYGKSDPITLAKDTILEAREQGFDLQKKSVEEIRKFMEENSHGIDCSGFVYHLLDALLKELGKGGCQKIGFPKVSTTNANLLTSDEFTKKVDLKDARAGDLIRLQNGEHCVIVLETKNGVIYAHSSGQTAIKGVHKDKIKDSFPEDLKFFLYNEAAGDSIRRLKVLE